MAKGRILVVDDEKLVRWSLQEDFRKEGYQINIAEDGKSAMAKIEADEYDIILLDIRLPDANGIEILKRVKQIYPYTIVIMMTAYADIETAIEAMKAGAYDYINKPFNIGEIRTRVERAIETIHLKTEVTYLRRFQREQLGADQLIGRSKPILEVLDLAQRLAKIDCTVLLLGESGTGKDLVARYIHFQGYRAESPFMEINCAALPETLLESELMGHEKGAFTDARSSKKGLFEQASSGTIFLDEVGDMPLTIQAKVLRLIDTKRFRRLGGLRDIEADVRIIAATNKNLKSLLDEGKLREDLYYRLKVMSILLPTLRERREDIPLLTKYFMNRLSPKHPQRAISSQSIDLLSHYNWPGNVRELKNVIERALILSDGGEILPKHLPPEILEDKKKRPGFALNDLWPGFALNDLEITPEGLPLEDIEREVIRKALTAVSGNISKAAKILHITRDTLRYRIKRLHINF